MYTVNVLYMYRAHVVCKYQNTCASDMDKSVETDCTDSQASSWHSGAMEGTERTRSGGFTPQLHVSCMNNQVHSTIMYMCTCIHAHVHDFVQRIICIKMPYT